MVGLSNVTEPSGMTFVQANEWVTEAERNALRSAARRCSDELHSAIAAIPKYPSTPYPVPSLKNTISRSLLHTAYRCFCGLLAASMVILKRGKHGRYPHG